MNTTKNHDDLAHIETMNAEQLREELRAAVAFHRECLVSNWQIKKNLADENKMLRAQLNDGIETLQKAAVFNKQADKLKANLTMWQGSCYGLSALVFVLALIIAKGIAA